MSLASWKEEFYPISAAEFGASSDPEEVVLHSLTKWRGMRSENLERHGCSRGTYGDIASRDTSETPGVLGIESSSCSLCMAYLALGSGGGRCGKCPLAIVRGGKSCDQPAPLLDETTSPWCKWTSLGDPEPMIGYLEKALEFVRSEKGGAQ